jgi:hypothetical protein
MKDKKDFMLGIVELLKLTKITPLKIKNLKEVIKFYELTKFEKYFIDSLSKNFNLYNLKKIRFYEIILYFEFMQINDFKKEKAIENVFEKIFESNIKLLNESLEKCFFNLLSRFENDQDKLLKICINIGLGSLKAKGIRLDDLRKNNEKTKIYKYKLDENMKSRSQLLVIRAILSNLELENEEFVRSLIREFNLENNINLAIEVLKRNLYYYKMFDENILFDKKIQNIILNYFTKKLSFNKKDIEICEIFIKKDEVFFKKIFLNNINKFRLADSYILNDFVVLHYIEFQDKAIVKAINKNINLSEKDISYILTHSKDKIETLKDLFLNKNTLQNLDKEAQQNKLLCLKLIQKNFENLFYIDESLKKDKDIKEYLDILNPDEKNIEKLELLNKIERIPVQCFCDESYIKLLDKTLENNDEYFMKLIEKLKYKNSNLYGKYYSLYNIITHLKNIKLSTIYKIINKFNYYDFRLLNIKELNKNKRFILKIIKFAPSDEIDLNLIDKNILDEKFILDVIKILKKRSLKFEISKELIKSFLNNNMIFKEFIKYNCFSEKLISILNKKQILFLLKTKNIDSKINVIKNMKKEYRNMAFIKEIIKHKPNELKYTNFNLRDNKKIVFLAIRYYPEFIKYASKRIKNKSFITACLKKNIWVCDNKI